MALPAFIELINVREFQKKSYYGGEHAGSYYSPAVAIQVKNTDSSFHSISVTLQKRNKQNVIVENCSIDVFNIPPNSIMEEEHVFHVNDKPGIWRIVGCRIDKNFYSVNEVLLNTPKKNCFVATAVYQNNDHPRVNELRHFRDQILEQTNYGRAFIKWYYKNGPTIASIIEQNSTLRISIKVILTLLARSLEILRRRIKDFDSTEFRKF